MRNGFLVMGFLLVIGCAYVLVRGGSITTREDVVSVGGVSLTAKTKQPILPWMAWAGIIGGGILIVSGLNKKS